MSVKCDRSETPSAAFDFPSAPPGAPTTAPAVDFPSSSPLVPDAPADIALPNLERWRRAKQGARRVCGWLNESEHFREAEEVWSCGGHLCFRRGLQSGVTMLRRGFFCQHHKLCAVCAIRRASRLLRMVSDKITRRRAEQPALIPYLVTFTRRHVHTDWLPAIDALLDAHRRLLGRRRQCLSRGNGWTESAHAEGMFWSLEAKRGSGDGLPHPHVHAVWLCAQEPSAEALAREWMDLTGDSDQVDVRPLHSVAAAAAAGRPLAAPDIARDLVEVCKYITKFSEMDVSDVWYLHANTKRRHFTGHVGVLRFTAAEVAALDAADESAEGDEPYLELVYRWSRFNGGRYEEVDVLPEVDEEPAVQGRVRSAISGREATHQRKRMTQRQAAAALAG